MGRWIVENFFIRVKNEDQHQKCIAKRKEKYKILSNLFLHVGANDLTPPHYIIR